MKRVLLFVCLAGLAVANTQTGDTVLVTDRGTIAAYEGPHLRVTVNADNCRLQLQGHVDALTVNGNRNVVTLLARTQSVELQGNNNTVSYSPKLNGTALNVADNGFGNTVKATP